MRAEFRHGSRKILEVSETEREDVFVAAFVIEFGSFTGRGRRLRVVSGRVGRAIGFWRISSEARAVSSTDLRRRVTREMVSRSVGFRRNGSGSRRSDTGNVVLSE